MSKKLFQTTAAAALLVTMQVGVSYAEEPATGENSGETDPETAQYEKQKKLYELKEAMHKADEAAEKASEARRKAGAAAMAAQFGPLASYDNEGGVEFKKADESAGKLEANLLATSAVRDAAGKLALRLCDTLTPGSNEPGRCSNKVARLPQPKLTYELADAGSCEERVAIADHLPTLVDMPQWDERPVIFLSETGNANFDTYEALMVRLTTMGKRMCGAIRLAQQQNDRSEALLGKLRSKAQTPAVSEGMLGGSALPAISTALDVARRLFETKYTVTDIVLNADNLVLIKETMAAYKSRRPGSRVFAPELFPLTPASPDNPLQVKLAQLDSLVNEVVAEAAKQEALYGALAPLAESASSANQAAVNAATSTHDLNRKALAALAKEYLDLLATLSTPADGKTTSLATALRQAETAQMLKRGGVLALLKTNYLGATSFTKKNFFTALGGMPFYVSGGTVVSYTVMDGQTGEVMDSISVPVAGGFHSVPEVHRTYRRRQARAAGGQ